jgi:thiol-disulfide isomerase/thioredoxin
MERIGADAFDGEKLRRPGPVAVAFLADWCPFCRAFESQFRALEGGVPFALLEGDVTDEESPLWETFHLDVVPTLVGFRDGAVVFRADGVLGQGLSERDLNALRRGLA